MIWGRLRKSTKEEEQKFAQMMKDEHVTFKERLLMTFVAYAVILVPCILVLGGFGLLILWMVRAI